MTNSSLVLSTINDQLSKKATTLKLNQQKKKTQWWQYLLQGLLGVVSIATDVVANAFLGPVGGLIVSFGVDVVTNIVGDYIVDNDPWQWENIIFNVVIPAATLPGKISSASKISKNTVARIAQATDDERIAKLAKQLQKIDINDNWTDDLRHYQKIIDDWGESKVLLNDDYKYTLDDVFSFMKVHEKKYVSIETFNKALRKTNKIASMLTDPNLVQKKFFDFVNKKTELGKYVSKKIDKFNKAINNWKKKYLKKVNYSNKPMKLIPLHHTKAPWIKGIKVFPVRGNNVFYYHVTIVFDQELTKGKQNVVLYNKSWKWINKFINAPSAGKYYINNISWGWDVGKYIRTNKKYFLTKDFPFVMVPSQLGQTIYLTQSFVRNSIKIYNDITNIEQTIQKWQESFTAKNIISNAFKSTVKVKGLNTTYKLIRAIEQQKITPVTKYVRKQIKKTIHRNWYEFLKQGQINNGVKNNEYRYNIVKK